MSRFITVNEAIDIATLGNRDLLQRAKGRYRSWAKHVWADMNLSSVKRAVRRKYKIDKRTNTVDLGCDFLQLSAVNVMDGCGTMYPVYRNDRLHDDMVEVPADRDCACEKKCSYKLCNTLKGYEAVVSTKTDYLPNGSMVSFECTDRKAVDAQGFLYEETQYPQRIYLSGVWTTTVRHTEKRKLCAFEIDEHGCVCDSESNIEMACSHCGGGDGIAYGGTAEMPPHNENEWIYYCNSKLQWLSVQAGCHPIGLAASCNNIYNISELGNRLIFPHNFGFDEVIVRYYAQEGTDEILIPMIALPTFIMGIKWWDARFDDNAQGMANAYSAQYAQLKFGLLKELNRYRIKELGAMMAQPRRIPSYIYSPNRYIGRV